MNRSQSYSNEILPSQARPSRINLGKLHSHSFSTTGSSPEVLEFLPATTYTPPSPRGRLVSYHYVRPSLRLDHHMMPSPEEIMAAVTRGHRSSSTSSTSSASSTTSTSSNVSISSTSTSRSEKRQGRIFMPTSKGLLDLLEHHEIDFSP